MENINKFIIKHKKTYLIKTLILLITVMITLCACQANPGKKAVVSKNQDYLKDINSENVKNNISDIPSSVQESFNLAKGNMTINAKVTLPETDVFPIQKIKPHEITNDDIDAFVNALFAGQTLYEIRSERSKEEIEQELIDTKQRLAWMEENNDMISENLDEKGLQGLRDETRAEIAELEKQYNNAKSESEYKDVATNAHFSIIDNEKAIGRGYVKNANGRKVIEAYKSKSLKNSYIVVADINTGKIDNNSIFDMRQRGEEKETTDDIANAKVTFSQAKAQADKIVQDTGRQDLVLDYGGHVIPIDKSGEDNAPAKEAEEYFFTYAKSYGGSLIPYVSAETYSEDPNNTKYSEPFTNEVFIVKIGEDGNVNYVEWGFPGDSVETIAENVQLLPFNEIMDKLKVHAKAIGGWSNMTHVVSNDINIYEIRLSYSKSAMKDNPNEYIIIPVWNFFCTQNTIVEDNGEKYENKQDGFRKSLVTINAIDGSVINQLLGY